MHGVCARADRLSGVLSAVLCALLFAACSSGGGGDGAATLSGSSSSAPAAATSSVTLAWAPADGPVAGYSVFVQRGTGPYEVEAEVTDPQVQLSGEPGTTARVVVVAFDADGQTGPSSPPSSTITFPDPAASEGAKSASTASDASDPTSTSYASVSSDGAAEKADASETPDDSAALDSTALAGSLVWQAGDAMRLTTAGLETVLFFPRPSPDAQLVAVGDLDADRAADIVWSDAAGVLFFTPGASLVADATETVDYGRLEGSERVLGAGDFDGDGADDLLVMRADAIDVWFTMPGGAIEIAEVGSAGNASLAGVGDFDGNGTDDVAWSGDEGLLVLWLMDASGAAASVEVSLGAGLEVVASGDFDADGSAEVAVRDVYGDVFVVRPMYDPALFEATDLADAGPWQSAGSADLDLDGTDDLVFYADTALRIGYLPGDEKIPLDASSPWKLAALLP
jgi:hypothetical protein